MTPTDVDEVAVHRAAAGDRTVSLTRAEMGEAWRLCEARGMSASAIAATLGVAERSVTRWRAHGYPSGTYQRGRWLREAAG